VTSTDELCQGGSHLGMEWVQHFESPTRHESSSRTSPTRPSPASRGPEAKRSTVACSRSRGGQ
jgi:hypothetical protein